VTTITNTKARACLKMGDFSDSSTSHSEENTRNTADYQRRYRLRRKRTHNVRHDLSESSPEESDDSLHSEHRGKITI